MGKYFDMFKKMKQLFKPLVRLDVQHIGEIAGHQWYKTFRIDDTIRERYLVFLDLSEQFESIGLKRNELHAGLCATQHYLNAGNLAKASEINSALTSFVEVKVSNDEIFSIVNCFVLIDDEPLDRFSPAHTVLKKLLYDSETEVKLFFCEIWRVLSDKSGNFKTGTAVWGYLKARLYRVSENLYLRAMQQAETLKETSSNNSLKQKVNGSAM